MNVHIETKPELKPLLLAWLQEFSQDFWKTTTLIIKTHTAQCARSLILLEKWGVKTFISSMQSGLLGTISSHSGVKLVSFHHLFQS